MREPTPFEQRVYDALCLVPEGQVTTYRDLGQAIGCGSSQAIGQALRRNPYAPEVPCHRVIASGLTLGGFAGEREGEEIRRKRRLLESEGVVFNGQGKLADAGFLYQF